MLFTILLAVLCGSLLPRSSPDHIPSADFVRQLSGLWRADEDRTPRDTDLDVRVFGPGAYDVRNVTLSVRPSGGGTLTVSIAVVGRNGHHYAPSVIEATLKIGDPITNALGKLAPSVTVVAAEERYLDGTHDHWAIEGSRTSITISNPEARELEFRFDTRDGRGSFGTTLTRRP
jgi:hypothetical protein